MFGGPSCRPLILKIIQFRSEGSYLGFIPSGTDDAERRKSSPLGILHLCYFDQNLSLQGHIIEPMNVVFTI